MNFADVANHFIPGYNLLPKKVKEDFVASEAGKIFVASIEGTLKSCRDYSNSGSFLTRFWGNEQNIQAIQESNRQELIEKIQHSQSYIAVITETFRLVLPEIYPSFKLLSENEQLLLLQAEFKRAIEINDSYMPLQRIFLLPEVAEVLQQLAQEQLNQQQASAIIGKQIGELLEKEDSLVAVWVKEFGQYTDMAVFKTLLDNKRIESETLDFNRRANKLAHFFSASYSNEVEKRLQEAYREKIQSRQNNASIEKQVLRLFAFNLLQVMSLPYGYLNLQEFNHKQGKKLAKKILMASEKNEELDLRHWCLDYRRAFKDKLDDFVASNERWQQLFKRTRPTLEILGSLSALIWHSNPGEKIKEFMDKVSDAHAFIQATGFSTQNENSFLAVLDWYNYTRTAEQIHETKNILFSLLKLFTPLYGEYQEIASYEKNPYLKIIKTLLPLIIISATVVLIAALLSPFALPELAFIVILIPTLFLGLALASEYVSLKNHFYQSFREFYYGGVYEMPEYQINERMIKICFEDPVKAKILRHFYIEQFKCCDNLEAFFQSKAKDGLLETEEIKSRKENNYRRHCLFLEWYDIHSNFNLGCDAVRPLISSRLLEIGKRELELFEAALKRELHQSLKIISHAFVQASPDEEHGEERISGNFPNSPMASNDPAHASATTQNYSPRLFKPISSLYHLGQLHGLVDVADTFVIAV
jgi:hypothetical protein